MDRVIHTLIRHAYRRRPRSHCFQLVKEGQREDPSYIRAVDVEEVCYNDDAPVALIFPRVLFRIHGTDCGEQFIYLYRSSLQAYLIVAQNGPEKMRHHQRDHSTEKE